MQYELKIMNLTVFKNSIFGLRIYLSGGAHLACARSFLGSIPSTKKRKKMSFYLFTVYPLAISWSRVF